MLTYFTKIFKDQFCLSSPTGKGPTPRSLPNQQGTAHCMPKDIIAAIPYQAWCSPPSEPHSEKAHPNSPLQVNLQNKPKV